MRLQAFASPSSWMRRIATNAAIDEWRRMASRPAQYGSEDLSAPRSPDPTLRRHLTAAVHALSPKLRVVAVLALIEERPLAEIADALDLPVGTVKSRLFRATQSLRATLTRLGLQP